jgi:hypothetical protein
MAAAHWPLGDKAVFTLQAALLMGKTFGREGACFHCAPKATSRGACRLRPRSRQCLDLPRHA